MANYRLGDIHVLRNNKKGGGDQKMATFEYVQKDLKTNICLFSAPVF